MDVSVAIAGPARKNAGTQPRLSTRTYLRVDPTMRVLPIATARRGHGDAYGELGEPRAAVRRPGRRRRPVPGAALEFQDPHPSTTSCAASPNSRATAPGQSA